MELIAHTAINLLEIPITKKDLGNFGIVYHPFFNSPIVPYNNEVIDIFKDKQKLKAYINELKDYIRKQESVYRIMLLINKPYQLYFLSLIQNYLDEISYANLLKECYVGTEFPNRDSLVSVDELRAMFTKTNKKLLMDSDEQNIFNNLPDELTIYRGFYSYKYYKALSWTLNIEKAHFFATRFHHNGSIYQANIKKENIYAYFDCRNEKEIVVNYDKLYNISKKEQFAQ